MNTHENLSGYIDMCISEDGYIRLSLAELQNVHLIHLESGLYDDTLTHKDITNKSCHIIGYTEWVTETEPVISVGWDWTIECYNSPPAYEMVGFPFSNIMLMDASRQDLEDDLAMRYIATYVEQMDWRDKVRVCITNKYS